MPAPPIIESPLPFIIEESWIEEPLYEVAPASTYFDEFPYIVYDDPIPDEEDFIELIAVPTQVEVEEPTTINATNA